MARYPSELQNGLLKVNGPLVVEFNHPDDSSSWHWGWVQSDRFYSVSWAVIKSSPETKEEVLAETPWEMAVSCLGTCWLGCQQVWYCRMLAFLNISAARRDLPTNGQWGGEKPSPTSLHFCGYLSPLKVSHLCMGSDCSTGAVVHDDLSSPFQVLGALSMCTWSITHSRPMCLPLWPLFGRQLPIYC